MIMYYSFESTSYPHVVKGLVYGFLIGLCINTVLYFLGSHMTFTLIFMLCLIPMCLGALYGLFDKKLTIIQHASSSVQ